MSETRPVVAHLVQAPPTRRRDPHPFGEIPLLACATACALAPDADHRVTLVADGRAAAEAHRLGLRWTHRHSPPLGNARLCVRPLRRLVRQIADGADAVHVWNESFTERVSAWLGPGPRIMSGLADETPLRPLGLLADRAALREALHIPSGRPIVAALADPIHRFGTKALGFSAGIAEICGVPPAIVMPRGAHEIASSLRFHVKAQRQYPLRITPAPMLALAFAADIVITMDEESISVAERCAVRLLESEGVRVITPRAADTLDAVHADIYDQLVNLLDEQGFAA